MKTSYFKIIAVLVVAQAFFLSNVNAQNERTMYYMQQIPESTAGNPAMMPGFKFYMGGPVLSSTYIAYHNNGFSYNDVISKRADDSLVFDQNKLLKAIGDKNDVGFAASIQLFTMGFKAGKSYITFSLNARENFNFHYTKDLMTLLIDGNAPFIGKTVDISGAKVYGVAYGEAALGFAREITPKLKLGFRLKYLYGVGAVNSQDSKVTLSTNPVTYALTAVSNIKVDYAFADNSKGEFDPAGMTKNPGFAFDFGAEYKVNDKLSLNASVLDVGSITWKEKVSNWTSTNPNSSFTFTGIKVDNLFKKNASNDSTFSHLGDTLKNKFNLKETHNSFNTILVKTVNFGASWHMNTKNLIGVLVRNEFFAGDYNPSVTLSLNHQFGRILSGTLSYSYIDRSLTNIGAGVALNLGPFQFYAVADNFFAAMKPLTAQTINMQVGLNLVIGNMLKKHVKTKTVSTPEPVITEPVTTPAPPTQK